MTLIVTKAELMIKRYRKLTYNLRVDTKYCGDYNLDIPSEIMKEIVKDYKLLVSGKKRLF